MMKKRYLILEDGQTFEGCAFGADAERVGELVFTTGMCGYIETLTDPSYYGQIVLQTFPSIGNYGIIPGDFEGSCQVQGYVVRDLCNEPSNFRSEGTVDEFLKKWGVPGISGVDTRELTRIIREHGVMNATLCDTPPASLEAVKAFRITDGVAHVSTKEEKTYPAKGPEKFRVALLDYGAKGNIIRELNKRGCTVDEYPANTPAEQILAGDYDGIMLSNGPGDPAENLVPIRELSKLFGILPMFGICLGHQLMALSQGGQTVKLKYGHRGANQPVRDLLGTRTYITSQNHGYAVVSESLTNGVLRYIQANDKTCEGIDYPDHRAFSVQFHPEACAGPADTSFLFDRFCDLMGGEEHAQG